MNMITHSDDRAWYYCLLHFVLSIAVGVYLLHGKELQIKRSYIILNNTLFLEVFGRMNNVPVIPLFCMFCCPFKLGPQNAAYVIYNAVYTKLYGCLST